MLFEPRLSSRRKDEARNQKRLQKAIAAFIEGESEISKTFERRLLKTDLFKGNPGPDLTGKAHMETKMGKTKGSPLERRLAANGHFYASTNLTAHTEPGTADEIDSQGRHIAKSNKLCSDDKFKTARHQALVQHHYELRVERSRAFGWE